MSWHYYARPLAPEGPPANLAYLERLARPRFARPRFETFLAQTQKEERDRVLQALRRPLPQAAVQQFARLSALPNRAERSRGKFTEPPRPVYRTAADREPPAPSQRVRQMAVPARRREKHVFEVHEPPPRQPVFHLSAPLRFDHVQAKVDSHAAADSSSSSSTSSPSSSPRRQGKSPQRQASSSSPRPAAGT